MADSSVLLNISEMIDLAIGTPEVGVVDFGMLQTVLHCLAQQLRILGKNVELRGSVAALTVGRENSQTIAINEYVVDTEKAPPARAPTPPPAVDSSEQETILIVERVKKVSTALSPSRSPTYPPPTPSHPSAAPSPPPPLEKLSLVTLSKFNILENMVEDLKNRVYGSIPKNEAILEEVRSQANLKAITDMWTSLNVSTRLEAAEAGIAKLSSLIQDQINDTAGLQAQLQDALKLQSSLHDEVKRLPAKPADAGALLQPVAPPPEAPPPPVVLPTPPVVLPTPPPPPPIPAGPPAVTKEELQAVQVYLDRTRGDLDHLTHAFYAALAEMQQAGADIPPTPPPPAPSPDVPAMPLPERRQPDYPRQSFSVLTAGLMDRINDLERRLKECCDNLGKNDGVIQDQINSFQDQLEYLMKQVNNLTDDLAAGKLSPDLIKDLQALLTLFETVKEMQEQLKQVHDTALHLASEKEDRQYHMNALLEQIELLKTIKMDREDMVEAMAEKADLRMLARKVSHDQFELACDDFSRGLEHALGKLNLQEALWQQALDDIQREIEMKLDKMEIGPMKDFFNNKLRQLQENLKQLSSLRREVEAAGTKQKLLRDVNCISCDANAVMKMEPESSLPVLKPMPPSHSMKPYLSYELDAIRKAQATNMQQRNLHDWEQIDKQIPQKQPHKVRSDTGKHICNRYCGGSHTVTTPAQRVARLGHFIKQWGPDVVPLSSGLAAGDDGRMYKVTTTEAANVGPGGAIPTTCTPKINKNMEMRAHKPISVTPECRCLEGDHPGQKT